MFGKFIKICQETSIVRQLIQASTPHHNGVAKRKNKTLLKKAQSMALVCNSLTYLQMETINTTTNLLNRCATNANNEISPEEKYLRVLLKVDNLRIFGSLTYVHVLENEQIKLDS